MMLDLRVVQVVACAVAIAACGELRTGVVSRGAVSEGAELDALPTDATATATTSEDAGRRTADTRPPVPAGRVRVALRAFVRTDLSVWDVSVTNGLGERVSAARVVAAHDGSGLAELVRAFPCDPAAPEGVVVLRLVALYRDTVPSPLGGWGDPAPGESVGFVDPGPLPRTFSCVTGEEVDAVYVVTIG